MSDPRLSVAIITKNEQDNIVEAIESVRFADQIVVADSSSDDNTVDIARNAGAEVHTIPFDGFGQAKNTALEFCEGDWILSIDADERVSPELAENIKRIIKLDNGPDYYAINRLTYFLGRPIRHSGWFPDYVVRLFRKGAYFSKSKVHESLITNGEVGRIEDLLYHYSYKKIDQYLDKLNNYTTLNSEQMYQAGKRAVFLDLLIHPPATFLKMYIFKAGFLDGSTGFILAALSSFQVLVKYSKLWRLGHREEL